MQQSGDTDDFLSVYWLYFAVSLTIPVCGCIMPEVRLLKGIGRKRTIEEQQLSAGLAPIVAAKSQSELETRQSREHAQEEEEEEQYHAPIYNIREILYLCFETVCRKSIFYPLYVTVCLNPVFDRMNRYDVS